MSNVNNRNWRKNWSLYEFTSTYIDILKQIF